MQKLTKYHDSSSVYYDYYYSKFSNGQIIIDQDVNKNHQNYYDDSPLEVVDMYNLIIVDYSDKYPSNKKIIRIDNIKTLQDSLKKYVSDGEKKTFTSIVQLNENNKQRWVTLVVSYNNNGKYDAYYIDSLNSGISDIISNILKGVGILTSHIYSHTFEQELSPDESDVWSIRNANAINNVLDKRKELARNVIYKAEKQVSNVYLNTKEIRKLWKEQLLKVSHLLVNDPNKQYFGEVIDFSSLDQNNLQRLETKNKLYKSKERKNKDDELLFLSLKGSGEDFETLVERNKGNIISSTKIMGDVDGNTLGHIASLKGNANAINTLLIKLGANYAISFFRAKNKKGGTVLHVANNIEVLQALSQFSLTNFQNSQGITAFQQAIIEGRTEVAKWFINNDYTSLDLKTHALNTAMIYAVLYRRTEISELLIKKAIESGKGSFIEFLRANIDIASFSLVHSAVGAKELKVAELILSVAKRLLDENSFKSFIDKRDSAGDVALNTAVAVNSPEAVDLLIFYGASIDEISGVGDWERQTPLQRAIKIGADIRIIRSLLEAGASADLEDGNGMVAASIAVEYKNLVAINVMYEYNKFSNLALEQDNKTPLHVAVLNGNTEIALHIIHLLVRECCSLPLNTYIEYWPEEFKKGRLSSQYLSKELTPESVDILLNLIRDIYSNKIGDGSTINAVDDNNRTAAHYAVEKIMFYVIKALKSISADFSIKDNKGMTAQSMLINKVTEISTRIFENHRSGRVINEKLFEEFSHNEILLCQEYLNSKIINSIDQDNLKEVTEYIHTFINGYNRYFILGNSIKILPVDIQNNIISYINTDHIFMKDYIKKFFNTPRIGSYLNAGNIYNIIKIVYSDTYPSHTDLIKIYSANDLLENLIDYINNHKEKIFTSIIFLDSDVSTGRWVTLVINFTNNKYIAYYADPTGYDIDMWVLFCLKIITHKDNIYNSHGIRYQLDSFSGGIWAILNANTINEDLKDGQYGYWVLMCLRNYKITDLQNYKMEWNRKLEKSSSLVKMYLENKSYMNKAINYPDLETNSRPPKDQSNKPKNFEEATLRHHDFTYFLSNDNIRDAINLYYPGMFDIYGSDEYKHSNRGIIILNDNKDLLYNLKQFMSSISPNKIKHPENQIPIMRTFIINVNQSHWVTLVVAVIEGTFSAYYADSLSNPVPKSINEILKTNQITNIICSTVAQQTDRYNCGFWALENARSIVTMLQQNRDMEWLRGDLSPVRLEEDGQPSRNNELYFRNRRAALALTLAMEQQVNNLQPLLESLNVGQDNDAGCSSHRRKRHLECIKEVLKNDNNEIYIKIIDNNGNERNIVIDSITNIQNVENYALDTENLKIKFKKENREYIITQELQEVEDKTAVTAYYISVDSYKVKINDILSNNNIAIEKQNAILNKLDEFTKNISFLYEKKDIEQFNDIPLIELNQSYDNVLTEFKQSILKRGVNEDTYNLFKDKLDNTYTEVVKQYIDDLKQGLKQQGVEFNQQQFESARIKLTKSTKFLSIAAIYDLIESITDKNVYKGGKYQNFDTIRKRIFGINGILDAIDDVRESLNISHSNKEVGKIIQKIPKSIRTILLKMVSNPMVKTITFITIAYQMGYSIHEISKGNHHILNYYNVGSSSIKTVNIAIRFLCWSRMLRQVKNFVSIFSKASLLTVLSDILITATLEAGLYINTRLNVIESIGSQLPLSADNRNKLFWSDITKLFTVHDVEQEYERDIRIKNYLNIMKVKAVYLLENDYNIAAIVLYVPGVTELYYTERRPFLLKRDSYGRIILESKGCNKHCEMEEKYSMLPIRNTSYQFQSDLSSVNISETLVLQEHVLDTVSRITRFSCNEVKCGFTTYTVDSTNRKVYLIDPQRGYMPYLTTDEYDSGLRVVKAPSGNIEGVAYNRKFHNTTEIARNVTLIYPKSGINLVIGMLEHELLDTMHCPVLSELCDRISSAQRDFVFSGKIEPFIFTNPGRQDLPKLKNRKLPKNSIVYLQNPERLIAAVNYPAVMHVSNVTKEFYGSKDNSTLFIINEMPRRATLAGGPKQDNTLIIGYDAGNATLYDVNLQAQVLFSFRSDSFNFINLANTYNYISRFNAIQIITTHCKTRYVDAVGNEVGNSISQGIFNCEDDDYEIRTIHNKDTHYIKDKAVIFSWGKGSGTANIIYDTKLNKKNIDVLNVEGANDIMTQCQLHTEDSGYNLKLLSNNNTQDIVSSVKINRFSNLMIQQNLHYKDQVIKIQDKDLSNLIEDMQYQILNNSLEYVDERIMRDSKSRVQAIILVSMNIRTLDEPSAYGVAKNIEGNNTLGIPIRMIQVAQDYNLLPTKLAVIGSMYSDEIPIDFSYKSINSKEEYSNKFKRQDGNIDFTFMMSCSHYSMITVEGGMGNDQYKLILPQYIYERDCVDPSFIINLYLEIRNEDRLYQNISTTDIVDLALLNITEVDDIKISKKFIYNDQCPIENIHVSDFNKDSKDNNLYIHNITFNSLGVSYSLAVGLVDYFKGPEYQHIIFQLGNNNFFKINDTGLEFIPIKIREEYEITDNRSTSSEIEEDEILTKYNNASALIQLPMNFTDIRSIVSSDGQNFIYFGKNESFEISKLALVNAADELLISPVENNTIQLTKITNYTTVPGEINELRNITNSNLKIPMKRLFTSDTSAMVSSSGGTFHAKKENHHYYWETPLNITNLYLFSSKNHTNVIITNASGVLDFTELNINNILFWEKRDGYVSFRKGNFSLILDGSYDLRVTYDGNNYCRVQEKLVCNAEIAAIDNELEKLNQVIIDGLKYLWITSGEVSEFDIHKYFGLSLLEEKEKFKKGMKEQGIDTNSLTKKILPCNEIVPIALWLMVKSYSDYWIGRNPTEDRELSKNNLIQCFGNIIDTKMIRRLIKNIENNNKTKNIVYKVKRFIGNHQQELQDSIRNNTLDLLRIDRKEVSETTLNCTNLTYAELSTQVNNETQPNNSVSYARQKRDIKVPYYKIYRTIPLYQKLIIAWSSERDDMMENTYNREKIDNQNNAEGEYEADLRWQNSGLINKQDFVSSSASKPEFKPLKLFKDTRSVMINAVKYLWPNIFGDMIQPSFNTYHDISSRLCTSTKPDLIDSNTISQYSYEVPNNNYGHSTPSPNTISCVPYAWDTDSQEYVTNVMSCISPSGQLKVFSNIWKGTSFIQTKDYYISGDSYKNCRPVEFYGRPSVYCEGEQTNTIYTPDIPYRLFDNLDSNLMLGSVIWYQVRKLYQWYTQPAAMKENESIIDITSQQLNNWKTLVSNIEELLKNLTARLGKNKLQWAKNILEDRIQEIYNLSELSTANVETVTELTENLEVLHNELKDFKEELLLSQRPCSAESSIFSKPTPIYGFSSMNESKLIKRDLKRSIHGRREGPNNYKI